MYWVFVAALATTDWYASGGNNHVNRLITALLIMAGMTLMGVPAALALMLGVAGAVWAATPFEWPRPIVAAGLSFGGGVVCWSLGVSVF